MSRLDDRIKSLSTLKQGWHYGDGKSISPEVLETVLELRSLAESLGATEMDVFPGKDGNVTLTVYHGSHNLNFDVKENETIEFSHEKE